MADTQPTTSLFELVRCLGGALDLAAPALTAHHHRVAYIAGRIASAMTLSGADRETVILAGFVHDAGALTLAERLGTFEFELADPHGHAERGSRMFESFQPLRDVAAIMRHHHLQWQHGAGDRADGEPVSPLSHVIHLADRAAVLVGDQADVLLRAEAIRERLARLSGSMFRPDVVAGFMEASSSEAFWLDAASPFVADLVAGTARYSELTLDEPVLTDLAALFGRVVDARSSYTQRHSETVGKVSEQLAELAGLPTRQARLVGIAGLLHDLGKLSVPAEILEKPARLDDVELARMKGHTYQGFRLLERVPALRDINWWGALHHERLDGSGYPFRLSGDAIPLEARIIAIADVYTALSEDRPYRKALSPEEVLSELARLAGQGKLDRELVSVWAAGVRGSGVLA